LGEEIPQKRRCCKQGLVRKKRTKKRGKKKWPAEGTGQHFSWGPGGGSELEGHRKGSQRKSCPKNRPRGNKTRSQTKEVNNRYCCEEEIPPEAEGGKRVPTRPWLAVGKRAQGLKKKREPDSGKRGCSGAFPRLGDALRHLQPPWGCNQGKKAGQACRNLEELRGEGTRRNEKGP